MIGCWSKPWLPPGSLNIATNYKSTVSSGEQKVASVFISKEGSFLVPELLGCHCFVWFFLYLYDIILIIFIHPYLPPTFSTASPTLSPLQIHVVVFLFIAFYNPLSLVSAPHMNMYVGSSTKECSTYQWVLPQKRLVLPSLSSHQLLIDPPVGASPRSSSHSYWNCDLPNSVQILCSNHSCCV